MRLIRRLLLTVIPGLALALLCVGAIHAQSDANVAHAATGAPTPAVNVFTSGPQAVVTQPIPSLPLYVPNQFISTGSLDEQGRLGSFMKGRYGGDVIRGQRIDLRFFTGISGTLFFSPNQLPTLFAYVYTVREGSGLVLEDVVTELNNNVAFSQMLIEFNLLIANPWSIAGSPWSIAGSPVTTPTLGADPELYWSQFNHLSEYGLGPLAGGGAPYSYTGEGVNIAIFDTSPYDQPVLQHRFQFFGGIPVSVTHVLSDPLTSDGLDPSPVHIPGHGLFVAGLARAVAPKANIVLYKVLDDTGRGRESDLLAALSLYSQTLVATPTVINLSFGVAPSVEITQLETLSNVLHGLHFLGNTIVAAAGNNSSLTDTKPMLYPAAFDFVVGVAAGNSEGHRSCYSNSAISAASGKRGIAAPGGQGDTTGGGCVPPSDLSHVNCPGDPLCMMTSWWDPLNAPHYTLGAGTSFAAPIVSGAAALTRQMKGPATSAYSVNQYLYDHAQLRESSLGYGTLNFLNMFLPARTYMPLLVRD